MTCTRRQFVASAAAALAAPAYAQAPDAQKLLAASDAVRNPGQPFSVDITLAEYLDGKRVDGSSLVSYSRTLARDAQFATLLRFTAPAREVGKLMLKSGLDLWFYDPSTQASVRLSPQQRLLGQASNGDVVTVNFARDYKATLGADEEVQDGERKTRQSHRLELAAASSDAAYGRIELWIERGTAAPIKGRFYAESGQLLKTVYYRRFKTELEADRPTEMVIIDGLNANSVTVMRLANYTARKIPDTWFQRDFLPRFKGE